MHRLITELHFYCEYRNGDLWLLHDWGSKRKAGNLLGSLREDGYREARINNKRFLVHHLVWLYHYDTLPMMLDHIDGDPSNNSIENLREVSHKTNLRNMKQHKNNTSGYTGVYWNAAVGKWQAYIKVDYCQNYLGIYPTIAEAVAARQAFIDNHPELGFSARHGQ